MVDDLGCWNSPYTSGIYPLILHLTWNLVLFSLSKLQQIFQVLVPNMKQHGAFFCCVEDGDSRDFFGISRRRLANSPAS